MTGFDSKRQMAQDKLDDAADTLSIVYQRGFADGKKAAQRKPLTDEQKMPSFMVALFMHRTGESPEPQTAIEKKLKRIDLMQSGEQKPPTTSRSNHDHSERFNDQSGAVIARR
jgi:hypothetical protein